MTTRDYPPPDAAATCAYCGWVETVSHDQFIQAALAHGDVCEKHPRRALEAEIERLRGCLSDTPSKWVRFIDRKPEIGQLVAIAYVPDGFTFDARHWKNDSDYPYYAWMALPELPK